MTEENQTDDILGDDFFIDEADESVSAVQEQWTLLIADDDPEVHQVTKLVLKDFSFEGKSFKLLHSYSGQETIDLIRKREDIVLVLLDVVMEKDDAGLMVVKTVREEMKNSFIRIILRTGQPGQAPEKEVIINYDINDYKEKSELTSQKLYTAIISALRSHRDLQIIEKSKQGLQKIIEASADLFEPRSLEKFSKGVFYQLFHLLKLDSGAFIKQVKGLTAKYEDDDFHIVATAEGFEDSLVDESGKAILPKEIKAKLRIALEEKRSFFSGDIFVGYFPVQRKEQNFLYLKTGRELNELERELVLTFSANVGVAFENLYLNREILDTQKELLYMLGETVETRSKETGQHVVRVALYTEFIAKKLGMDEEELELLKHASPLHDIGKLGVPDSILNKQGRLDGNEFEVMKSHSEKGYKILFNSKRKVIQTAAKIAKEHHERWDGKGYPHGLKADEINLYSRITTIADVFDALSHERIYKKAWSIEKILDFFREQSGKIFDPKLIDLFIKNIDSIQKIKDENPD